MQNIDLVEEAIPAPDSTDICQGTAGKTDYESVATYIDAMAEIGRLVIIRRTDIGESSERLYLSSIPGEITFG